LKYVRHPTGASAFPVTPVPRVVSSVEGTDPGADLSTEASPNLGAGGGMVSGGVVTRRTCVPSIAPDLSPRTLSDG